MAKPRTAVVLGAGASADYGFPLGRDLRDAVCRLCRKPTTQLCDITGISSEEYVAFGQRLAESGYTSVDWYLELNAEDMPIGECAIVAALTAYEKPERLFPGPKHHWYEVLLNWWWTETADLSGGDHVTFLTFNYDRSLEHYLATASARRKNVSMEAVINVLEDDAGEIVVAEGPRIIHLHGQLNGPYQNIWSSERLETNSLSLLSSVDDDSPEFRRAREVIADCEKLYFLGFGFNPKSVARLGDFDDPDLTAGFEVSGTHGGFTPPAWQRKRDEVFPRGWTECQGWSQVADFVQYNVL